MKKPQRIPWIGIGIGMLAVIVVALGASFVVRILNPPLVPIVQEGGKEIQIQVEIVNASGVQGAGKKVMKWLRSRGFDVVEISTADSLVATSMVIDRVGDRASALSVAKAVTIPDTLVLSNIDSMRFVRASVVLGRNIHTLDPFSEND